MLMVMRSLSTSDRNYSLEDVNLQRVEPTLHPRADGSPMQPAQLELVGHSIVRILQFEILKMLAFGYC